jgi:hypothetical protein
MVINIDKGLINILEELPPSGVSVVDLHVVGLSGVLNVK